MINSHSFEIDNGTLMFKEKCASQFYANLYVTADELDEAIEAIKAKFEPGV